MPSSDDDDSNSSSSVSDDWNRWLPRRNLRETNWLYRVDTLRPHDNREMDLYLRLSQGLLFCTMKFIVYAFSLKMLISSESNANIKAALHQVFDKVMGSVYIVQSEAYCSFISFLEIAYYPTHNMITKSPFR